MPKWIHERAEHILAKNPSMDKGQAFAIATQQSHATGKSPKGFGTAEGRHEAKIKYEDPKGMVKKPNPGNLKSEKLAFVEALPTLTGLATGYNPGRSVAAETAAALAPKGRVSRSENIARNLGVIGAPVGGLAAMALARKYKLAPRLAKFVAREFPRGVIAAPRVEREIVHLGVPGAAAIGGSLAGGAATGALVGGIQHLRGPVHKEKHAELKPSPMWSSIGGGASNKPAWRAQSGFTPTGMTTPAEKLQKSMSMGKIDGSAGLKPLDIKVAEVNQMRLHPKSTLKVPAATAPNPTFRPKLAFQMSQYSGDMSMPPMQYASGIPPFKDPPVKTAGPPSEKGQVKKAGIGQETMELVGPKAVAHSRGINLEPYTRPLMGVLDDIAPIVMRKQRQKAQEVGTDKVADAKKDEDVQKGSLRAALGAALGIGGGAGTALGGDAYVRASKAEASDPGLMERLTHSGGVPVHKAQNLGSEAMFFPGRGNAHDDIARLHKQWGISGADPTKTHVVLGELADKPSVLAHELGHAKVNKGLLGRMAQHPSLLRMSPLRNSAALGLGALTGASDDERVQKAGLIGSGLLTVPQLATEASASINAYRKLKELGASPQQMQAARRTLLPAFATYAGAAAGTVGLAMIGSGLVRALKHIDEEPVDKLSSVTSPASQLSKSQSFGAPKVTAPPGPSIAQISKPVGFGRAISGAKKGVATI